jgi:phosphate transport system substrate-binding protein
MPILDGAAALVPVYASIINSVYPKGCVTYEGGAFSDDNYYGENFASDSKMQYKNTVRGYKAIVDGDTDILFCAAPSKAQKQYAEEKGVELVYVPIGLEGFVFFVNENNPVDDLTTEQIRKIYSCEYTNWSEVGGANRIINPVTRLEGSGSQTAFEAFMGEYEIGKKSPLAITGASIGFSFRYYMDGIVENSSVKMLSLNGVYPSRENIQNRTYPIVAQFYAIYRADNDNENVKTLIDWILSDEGQSLIEQTGYVRIN